MEKNFKEIVLLFDVVTRVDAIGETIKVSGQKNNKTKTEEITYNHSKVATEVATKISYLIDIK